ncbi:MAG TPA: MarC family protein [Candidatus Acidoferrales bacterium]|jgi:multiple antibiotic resistance protein|nr:MarC family protein [Candidatus Acidoferrales bacterium]
MPQIVTSTLLVLTALFPIVNPLGSAPLFLSLTRYYTGDQRKMLSRRIALNSIALIVGSYFVGTHILAFFGISIPVVQVGGGLVLASTGWAMLKQKDEDDTKAGVHRNVDTNDLFQKAFYPLTLPLTIGPGSISVAITLGANEPHREHSILFSMIGAVIGAVLIAGSVYLCYAFADRLAQVLGATSMSVIMRLSSFLLVCIGTQIIWNGLSAMLKTLPVMGHPG